MAASLSSVAGGVFPAIGYFRQERAEKRSSIDFVGLAAVAGAALMLYGALLLAFLFAQEAIEASLGWGIILLAGMPAISGIVAWRTDLNVIALHRLYRDRLMETFLPDPDKAGRWHRAAGAETYWLKDASPAAGIGPDHLINTNLILTRSKKTSYAGRGGDSFVFAPLMSGSDATGWYGTAEWIQFNANDASRENDYLSLATAMAISGAAVSPNAGSAGQGPTRSRLVSLAMNFLNLRLSCWLPNPSARADAAEGVATADPPPPTWWTLVRQVIEGVGSAEKGIRHEGATLIELSDGGHFENLGLYELVRQRVKTIIVADAGCDPCFGFADLGNALERCRVDFGVDIRFRDTPFDLRHVLPGSAEESPLQSLFPLAYRGVAVGRINYPGATPGAPSEIGHLVYIKSTLTENLSADVYAYRSANADFPDQGTGDQWFDEAQFEAYRELGYDILENFIAELAADPAAPTITAPGSADFGLAKLCEWLHGRERQEPETEAA